MSLWWQCMLFVKTTLLDAYVHVNMTIIYELSATSSKPTQCGRNRSNFLAYVYFKQIYEVYFSLIIFDIADIEHNHNGAVFSLHRSPSMIFVTWYAEWTHWIAISCDCGLGICAKWSFSNRNLFFDEYWWCIAGWTWKCAFVVSSRVGTNLYRFLNANPRLIQRVTE